MQNFDHHDSIWALNLMVPSVCKFFLKLYVQFAFTRTKYSSDLSTLMQNAFTSYIFRFINFPQNLFTVKVLTLHELEVCSSTYTFTRNRGKMKMQTKIIDKKTNFCIHIYCVLGSPYTDSINIMNNIFHWKRWEKWTIKQQ